LIRSDPTFYDENQFISQKCHHDGGQSVRAGYAVISGGRGSMEAGTPARVSERSPSGGAGQITAFRFVKFFHLLYCWRSAGATAELFPYITPFSFSSHFAFLQQKCIVKKSELQSSDSMTNPTFSKSPRCSAKIGDDLTLAILQ
jgi:hypothetical protein